MNDLLKQNSFKLIWPHRPGLLRQEHCCGNSGGKRAFWSSNLDNVGHQALRDEKIRKSLLAEFGGELLSAGEIDRKKLGKVVFSCPKRLMRLNSLTWPWMRIRTEELLKLIPEGRNTAFSGSGNPVSGWF